MSYWTSERVQRLVTTYGTLSPTDLKQEFSGTTWSALYSKARLLGLKRPSTGEWSRKGTLQPLLEEKPTSYYWNGFIAADGGINHRGQLRIDVHSGKAHLQKLGDLLDLQVIPYKAEGGTYGTKKKYRYTLCIQDKTIGRQLAEKFDVQPDKTYNPPSIEKLSNLDQKLMIAYLIGFIDGDGYKRPDYRFRIENHASWIFVHNYFIELVNKTFDCNMVNASINRRGFSVCNLSMQCIIDGLYNFINQNDTPVLSRKWDRK